MSKDSELSPEDLEVLRAFHATNTFAVFQDDHEGTDREEALFQGGDKPGPYPTRLDTAFGAEEEMLIIFADEADEDITALRRALEQAEALESIDSPGILTLQRVAHKIRGTAAAIGCDAMSAIAHYIEIIIQHMKNGEIILLSGLFALGNAVGALEMTLHSVVTQGQENMQPLLDLEQYYAALDIHAPTSAGEDPSNREEAILQGESKPRPYVIDRQHLGQLIQHTEQLVEQQTALEQARKQVETALQELHAAQARLRRVEAFFAIMPMAMQDMDTMGYDEHPPSSLVARILREATLRTGHIHQAKAKAIPRQSLLPLPLAAATLWDELELDRFSEANLLAHALNEAIADVSTTTSQLQHALAHLDTLVKQHVTKARVVRADALLLRMTPFSTLSRRLQKVAQKVAHEALFEITGETVEIDQDILETLADPLVQLIKTHLAEALHSAEGQSSPCHIRLDAHTIGSEVIIEIGFSLPMSGGILDMLQEFIQPLHGSIKAQLNATGGMDFRLRFPHAKGVAQGLLIRAGGQYVIVPFSEVQRIDYQKQEQYDQLYALNVLLGFSHIPAASKDAINRAPTRPVLILQADTPSTPRVAVQVDEVVGQIELVMKPPAPVLRRPGITGMAIDSTGNVLLVLDVPELIRQSGLRERSEQAGRAGDEQAALFEYPEKSRPKVLIADDSVSIRHSLHQTLSQKDYVILEARDGSEALELLAEEAPDLLLLDLEMPNMNGYDVLNILRTRAMLPHLKIILLTSRTSDKHKRRAHELGAHTYLTKPCPDDDLLNTVASLLASNLPR